MARKKRSEASPEDVQPLEMSGNEEDMEAVSDPSADPPFEPAPELANLPIESAKASPAVVLPLKPAIALDVFVRITPVKDDQLAGFRHWARKTNQGPKLPIKEWQALYQQFMNRPIR